MRNFGGGMMKQLLAIVFLIFIGANSMGQSHVPVVADSVTRSPLGNASAFNKKGRFIGMSNSRGKVYCASVNDYPLTVRYLGFFEKVIPTPDVDTVFMQETAAELPEVVVESRQHKMLHVLAYVREYSTLTSYTDTVTMFREKMVDFMLPGDEADAKKGWRCPRVLNSKSYYRFTNSLGLDSVSDRCNHHFTWSDWIGLTPPIQIPAGLRNREVGSDTIFGKYSPTEIWVKNGDRFSIDINVLADTTSRKWVPNISSFFRNDDLDFEQFRLRLNYSDVVSDYIAPLDITGFSFNIESRGRGHRMFRFNRHDQPFFVATYTEVYILDKEYITMKEAKKWEKGTFDAEAVEILEPADAPELQPDILALIDRVAHMETDKVRRSIAPDRRLLGRNVRKENFGIGYRALSLLKQLTGITLYKSHKNANNNWKEFLESQRKRNSKRTD